MSIIDSIKGSLNDYFQNTASSSSPIKKIEEDYAKAKIETHVSTDGLLSSIFNTAFKSAAKVAATSGEKLDNKGKAIPITDKTTIQSYGKYALAGLAIVAAVLYLRK